MEEALQKVKRGKAPGPSGVTTDLLKYARETGVQELKKVFELIETEERAPTEWGSSYTIPIYKGKGDALLCGKYSEVARAWNEDVGEDSGEKVERYTVNPRYNEPVYNEFRI